MKKTFYISFISLFISLISAPSYGLFFHNKHYTPGVDPNFCKYSQLDWYEDEGASVKRTILPSKNDVVVLLGNSNYTIEFDQDINVGNIDMRCNLKATGKKFKLAKKFDIILPEENQTREAVFEKCQIDITGDLSFRSGVQFNGATAGMNDVKLIDSTLKAGGSITLSFQTQKLNNKSGSGGIRFVAQGKSKAEFKQGIRLDAFALSYPKLLKSYIDIQEASGNVPEITFGGNYNDLVGGALRVRCTPSIKKGKYNIVNFTSKEAVKNPFQNVIINGKTVNLGETVQIGELTAKVYMGASGSDKAENDYILEIK